MKHIGVFKIIIYNISSILDREVYHNAETE
ncbi:hypothetical protein SH1V18_35120 [Vallitalea longa]|uniref:Uncharacterized protein n=1 Tax=Vallitalea longa TaxID=2936439 RepID=A0A9W5YCM8_9FIRM|nr:hypothetical protein SH1V18_35120 [Vallitalea longa]